MKQLTEEREILMGNLLICNFMQQGDIAVRAKYHSSWDWLMPVVEKIESLVTPNSFDVDIHENYCTIYQGNYKKICSSSDNTGRSKIAATWDCVVKFIQWLNQNKGK